MTDQDQKAQGAEFYDDAWENWDDMIRYSPAPRIRRERILARIARLGGADSLLDVGCGNGEFISVAKKRLPGINYTGADISPEVVKKNSQRIPDAQFVTLNLNEANLDERFDVVTCMEVVEHCDDFRAAIQRLAAMTGRRLFVTVPCGPLFEIDRRVGHTRHFSPEEMAGAAREAGLEVVRAEAWGWPFFNLYKHLINRDPDAMMKAYLSSDGYTQKQKALATLVYALFRVSLPFGGYQLFLEAKRPGA